MKEIKLKPCYMRIPKPCQLTDVESSGSMTITKLDRTNRLIVGIFNATLSKAGCDTIKITNGRFDVKF